MEYDMEMNDYQNTRRTNPFGYGYFEEDDMIYERRGPGYSQERKRRCLTEMEGPMGSEVSPMGGPPPHAFQMVQVFISNFHEWNIFHKLINFRKKTIN